MQEGEKIEILFEKFKNGTCTEEEIKTLQAYLKRDDLVINFEQMMDKFGLTVQLLDALKTPASGLVSKGSRESFKKIVAGIGPHERPARIFETPSGTSQKSAGVYWLKAAVAAVLLVLFAWVLYTTNKPGTAPLELLVKETQRGQKSTITLADGSTVMLNAQSRLTYPRQFAGTREVVLEGEAFFLVNHNPDKPFVVRSGRLQTTVLGTSFNIEAFPEKNIKVTVATGKVRVRHTNHRPQPNNLHTEHANAKKPGPDGNISMSSRIIPANETAFAGAIGDKPTFAEAIGGEPAFAEATADKPTFAEAIGGEPAFAEVTAGRLAFVKASVGTFSFAGALVGTFSLAKVRAGISGNVNGFAGTPVFTATTTRAGTSAFAKASADTSVVVLTKAEQAVYNIRDSTIQKRVVNVENFLAWKDGILKFNEVRLEEAVATLSRWYNVDFSMENEQLNDCIIIGEYKNQSLVSVLENLRFLGLEYEFTEEGTVLLSGEGCGGNDN